MRGIMVDSETMKYIAMGNITSEGALVDADLNATIMRMRKQFS